ncbi:ubiquitin-conjugating enzyme [Phlyctema vagabunda]|uniref:Ubiquitin-conjugating enzyme n=1 Tax=Phlyctema vagabunda TaxID=108571 RepID=A0ABR4P1X2_9HELO
MATMAANKRLTREYKTISANPPPYIQAHPSESNILEWHYIITGPENTPYHGGQYWGTLMFPPDYPFAPPAIRMHTPSGRFQPSTRLCLSISDFHPKSFNPAWEVSTILIGLLSFMTSDEMTTGSVSGSPSQRKRLAAQSKWWNSTGGGSCTKPVVYKGNIKAGDGGHSFKTQWPELHKENEAWMKEQAIDLATGTSELQEAQSCSRTAGLTRPTGSQPVIEAVVEGGRAAGDAGQSWFRRNRLLVLGSAIFVYVLIARIMGKGDS